MRRAVRAFHPTPTLSTALLGQVHRDISQLLEGRYKSLCSSCVRVHAGHTCGLGDAGVRKSSSCGPQVTNVGGSMNRGGSW